ncbi:MAG TPA: VWA domain-containing protein [Ruminococcus sp.]|nr:VWA domain-containing protein [Ruminococcus sp.]
MGSNYKAKYDVDLVFVIDATGSMTDLIDMVKENALRFHVDLCNIMSAKKKIINQLRIRLIAFRDYMEDGENAMMLTDFFTFPEQAEDFREAVNSIEADGGGDEPEDGLEALGFAIRSDWCNNSGTKKRHVIVVWSDASTHELGFGSSSPYYNKDMAKNFDELTRWWGFGQTSGYIDNRAKRLLLYTPDAPDWNKISSNWENVIHFQSVAGNGLAEADYSEIINTIAQTV